MKYSLRYSKHINWKRFAKLPRREKQRIYNAIHEKLIVDPISFGKPLNFSLTGARSFRIGDYRIIYTIKGEFIEILLIGHRSTVYTEAERIL